MKKLLFAAGALFFVSFSYAQTQPKLNEPLLREAFTQLKDSASAKFRDLRYAARVQDMWDMCGSVNAKNSFGAYTGFEPFYGLAVMTDTKPKKLAYIVMAQGDIAESMCREKGL